VYIEGSLVLDGSLSYDENYGTNALSTLAYSWSCTLVNAADYGKVCSILQNTSINAAQLSVPGNLFLETKTYLFQVLIPYIYIYMSFNTILPYSYCLLILFSHTLTVF
jgi:hypothetical protein